MKYCVHCGNELLDEAIICPKCGCASESTKKAEVLSNSSSKSRLLALLLCIFVGGFGVHRFYVGKIGTGILWLFTGGCLGIGTLIDVIIIACGSFKDKEGKILTNWNLD